jgi:hypothetical protein
VRETGPTAAALLAAAFLAAGCSSPHTRGAAALPVGKVPPATASAGARGAAPDPGGRGRTHNQASGSVSASSPPSSSPSASPAPSRSAVASIDPGTLPQTDALPGTDDAQFLTGVASLWIAIVKDDPSLAMPFFFPQTAYMQVKDIPDPQSDYENRLIAWYRLDIHAAHQALGPDPQAARFTGVDVPTGQAEWIDPGVEYNKGSYYRVYGTRISYRVDGRDKSFGVFSLISWRGEWYVVHLGPSTRDAMQGIVYDPEG